MSRLLYIESSPRHAASFSSRAATEFLDAYLAENPACTIDKIHLFDDAMPEFDQEAADQKMQHIKRLITAGQGLEPTGKWAGVLREIERLKSADKIVISAPMWNFSVPYPLKQYIDVIVQPGLTFGVNKKGAYVGLLRDKRAQLLLASGSAYADRFPRADDAPKTDFMTCYLQHILRYMGIEDIRALSVGPTEAVPPGEAEQRFTARLEDVRAAAREF